MVQAPNPSGKITLLKPDPWAQRAAFVEAVDAYVAMTGKKHPQVAKELGISFAYLKNILYKSKTPGIEPLIMAALVFGCSPAKFTNHAGLLGLLKARTHIDLDALTESLEAIDRIQEIKGVILPAPVRAMRIAELYSAALTMHTHNDGPVENRLMEIGMRAIS